MDFIEFDFSIEREKIRNINLRVKTNNKNGTHLFSVFPTVRGATTMADTVPRCDDDGDGCRDGVRDGVRACPDEVQRCHRAQDDGMKPGTRVAT